MEPKPTANRIGTGTYFEIFATEMEGENFVVKRPKTSLKDDPRIRRMLRTEAEVLSALSGNARFPKLHRSGEDSVGPFTIMERLRGFNLDEGLRNLRERKTLLTARDAAEIALQISEGVVALHALSLPQLGKVVHGDLKPHNLMMLSDGKIKIIDLSLEGGTFGYMPPERMDSHRVEAVTDLFALGLILYEVLTNEALAPGETKMDVYFRMKDLRRFPPSLPPSIPRPLAEIIDKSLKAGLKGGYADAEALRKDLSEYLGSANLTQGADSKLAKSFRLES